MRRFHTYARQQEYSRSYYRVLNRDGAPQALTPKVLSSHLKGEITVGLYSVDRQGMTKWNVIDSDEGLGPLLAAKGKLAEQGIAGHLERSRAGGHLWIFWNQPIRPDTARKILSPYASGMELFPAGDVPDDDGLGLVIRAPLGIHRLTMHRYGFIDDDARPVSSGVVRGQIEWLMASVTKTDPAPLIAGLPKEDHRQALKQAGAKYQDMERGPIAAWVASVDVRAVVGQYVELSRSGIGHCPWPERHKHGDRHRSFAVFQGTQKWWCFTERIGGNAFDFLCRYHQLEPVEMLRQIRVGQAR